MGSSRFEPILRSLTVFGLSCADKELGQAPDYLKQPEKEPPKPRQTVRPARGVSLEKVE